MTIAFQKGNLHRNFMGYSASKTQLMIGLGVSAISDSWLGFGQNAKSFDDYYQMLEWNQIPINKGHVLTDEDLIVRKHILNIMCTFQTTWNTENTYFDGISEVLPQLKEFKQDDLLEFIVDGIQVTEKGKAFVRNICMAFDMRLQRKAPERQLFSMTV
jgi:oxygen-independent coproporphyrinogen-3 oxidase